MFTPKKIMKLHCRILCAAVLLGAAGNFALAVDGEWTSATSRSNWDDTSNWADGIIAEGAGSTVTVNRSSFTGSTGVTATIREDGVTFGHLHIFGESSAGSRNLTVNASGSGVSGFTIDAGDEGTSIIRSEGAGSLTLNVGTNTLFLGSSATFINQSSVGGFFSMNGSITSTDNSVRRTLTFNAANQRVNYGNGSISGNIALVLEGSTPVASNHLIKVGNTTSFRGNTYTGGTTIRGGVWVEAWGPAAFSTGDVVFEGLGGQVIFRVAASSPDEISNNIIINEGATATFNGNYYNGTKLSGVISGEGSLAITTNASGNATNAIILDAANTYAGGTHVEVGSLLVNNVEGSGTGSGDVRVAAGTLLGGSGSIAGKVLTEGVATLQVGFEDKAGFSIGGLTLGGDLTISYGDAVGLLDIVGQLDMGGHNITFDMTGYSGEELTLISFASLSNGDISNFSLTGSDEYRIALGTNGVMLTAIPEPGAYAALMAAGALLFLFRRKIR